MFNGRDGKALPNAVRAPYINRGFATNAEFNFDYFMINVDLANGLSGFNVDVQGQRYDNGGNGFRIQDQVVFQQADSCFNSQTRVLNVYGVVSTRLRNPRVSLEVFDKRPRISSIVPGLVKDSVRMERVTNPNFSIRGYNLYQGSYTYTTSAGGEFSVVAVSGGRRIADEYKKTTLYNGVTCPSA
ncbi:hypothetical protein AX17_004692 [Amanita inopinata Kibby_2008]|nr:hypothetical protein AX17_004692 [Amanita inopinata Kibby_2008]